MIRNELHCKINNYSIRDNLRWVSSYSGLIWQAQLRGISVVTIPSEIKSKVLKRPFVGKVRKTIVQRLPNKKKRFLKDHPFCLLYKYSKSFYFNILLDSDNKHQIKKHKIKLPTQILMRHIKNRNGSNMHGYVFARRVKYARRDTFARRHFCTEGHFCTKGQFA